VVHGVADDGIQREVLPIPDRRQIGLTTYDAKDSDTSFPRIRRLRPPADPSATTTPPATTPSTVASPGSGSTSAPTATTTVE
jgi:hypothetical protein